jgi:hypothetical protein
MKKIFSRFSFIVWGLIADLIIISLASLYFAFGASGRCASLMDGPSGNCSVIGSVIFEVIFFLLFMLLYYWWISLPVLLLPLILGLILDINNTKLNS